MKQSITIKATEQLQTKTGNTKITLKDDSHKYYFYKNKKDGSETKAFQQWRGLPGMGTVTAEVNSEEKSFVNDKGKKITYMDNYIAFFYAEDTQEHINVSEPQENAPQTDLEPLTAILKLSENQKKITAEILKLKEEIAGLKATLSDDQLAAYEMGKGDTKIETTEETEEKIDLSTMPF